MRDVPADVKTPDGRLPAGADPARATRIPPEGLRGEEDTT
jgi:hypothetical protein